MPSSAPVLRVLAITKIFPNAAEPLSAPFNRQQFAALAKHCELTVMATMPWFPGARWLSRWSSAGQLASVPRREEIEGIAVTHPRTLFVPRLAHGAWGPLYAASIAPAVVRHRGQVDVVLGSWAYPDGFAAVIAARMLRRAVRGEAARQRHQRDREAARPSEVDRVGAAARRARGRGQPRTRRRGGDPRCVAGARRGRHERRRRRSVQAGDRAAARAELGPARRARSRSTSATSSRRRACSISRARGRTCPAGTLAVVGGGPAKAALEEAVAPYGDRVRLAGPQPLASIPRWLAACDVLVLPSHAEGTPNVVLEALACGRRVVATAVGGIPDLITRGELGELVPPHDPDALGAAIARALATPYDPAAVARLGARGGWDASAAALHAVLAEAAGARPGSP